MGRRLVTAAMAAACFVGLSPAVQAAERKALVKGVSDRALLQAIERAVGDSRQPAGSRLEARRRAREASESAEALLRSEGFYDAEITAEIGDGEHPRATLVVVLGPRTTVAATDVAWAGAPPDTESQAAARKAVALPPGAPARAIDVIAAEGRAVAALEARGYADARAEPRVVTVDHADHAMRPVFHVAAGALVRLDGLKLVQIGRTSPKWLLKLKPWSEGEAYRPDLVGELERRLLDTQVYDAVTVALAPQAEANPDGTRPVLVNLVDRARRALDFSAGYSTTEGADFDVRLSLFNRFHRGDTLTLQARLAELDSRYGPELSLPDWKRPGQTLRTSLLYLRTVTDAYTETGGQISTDITRRYGKTSYITLGTSLTDSRVDDRELGSIDIDTLRVFGAFLLDHTDSPLDPRHGFKLDARVTPTGITGDETTAYVKAVAQASFYLPIDRKALTVLAFRGRVGSILGGGLPEVPSSDRFFAGGGGSVRGYEYQSVGPHYPDGTPLGGLSLVEGSAEIRRRFEGTPFGAVAFLDAGSVGKDVAPEFQQISTAVGIGLRYDLGFAPVRIDIATPLQKPAGVSQASFQVYLSVGQSF